MAQLLVGGCGVAFDIPSTAPKDVVVCAVEASTTVGIIRAGAVVVEVAPSGLCHRDYDGCACQGR